MRARKWLGGSSSGGVMVLSMVARTLRFGRGILKNAVALRVGAGGVLLHREGRWFWWLSFWWSEGPMGRIWRREEKMADVARGNLARCHVQISHFCAARGKQSFHFLHAHALLEIYLSYSPTSRIRYSIRKGSAMATQRFNASDSCT